MSLPRIGCIMSRYISGSTLVPFLFLGITTYQLVYKILFPLLVVHNNLLFWNIQNPSVKIYIPSGQIMYARDLSGQLIVGFKLPATYNVETKILLCRGT